MPNASASSDGRAAEIALDLPLYDTYHYRIPPNLEERAVPGMRVLVPVGNRMVTGYLIRYSEPPEDVELKFVEDLLDEHPVFDDHMWRLFRFASRYFFTPLGETIKSALPAGINVESRQRLMLSQTGRMARDSGLIRGPKEDILEAFDDLEELTRQQLLKRVASARHYHIRDLVRDGFLDASVALTKPRIKPKMVRFYRPVVGVSIARQQAALSRSSRQREIFHAIVEHEEPISDAELRRQFGGISSILRALLKKGLLDVEEREVSSDPFFAPLPPQREKPTLSEGQQAVYDSVIPGLEKGIFQPFLLHGVTGSGKTEIYLRIIERVLELGRQAIVLIPEIALTPQFVSVFRSRLGDQMTVLHSALSARERYDQWRRIARGEVPLVIGARSAVFAPFANIGVIIVDEEHETSYKQDGKFPYHARNLALVRGKDANATVILGSATPAMESFAHAQNGKWSYLSMPVRVNGRPLPEIEIIDLRQAGVRSGGLVSDALQQRIAATLEKKEQVVLFLNRRGYNTSILCPSCGHTFGCPYCSVSLTYYRADSLIVCHYCGYSERLPRSCPACKTQELERLGLGTERAEEILQDLFPEAVIARMDRDSISKKKGSLEKLVERIASGEVDIILGTQMVAKGHDFHNVTLVGVLLADTGLNLPDFRSSERTFQLLMQVAGRAGRGALPGKVVIQTFNPEHPSIQLAKRHDYPGFFKIEMGLRRELGYPPFGWLVLLRFEGEDPDLIRRVAEDVGRGAMQLLDSGEFGRVVFLGPAPAPVERIKSRFRWQMMFKGPERGPLHSFVWSLRQNVIRTRGRAGVKISIDADPMHML